LPNFEPSKEDGVHPTSRRTEIARDHFFLLEGGWQPARSSFVCAFLFCAGGLFREALRYDECYLFTPGFWQQAKGDWGRAASPRQLASSERALSEQ